MAELFGEGKPGGIISALIIVLLFSSIGLAFFGFQQSNLSLLAVGVIFSVSLVGGVSLANLAGVSIINTKISPQRAALIFLTPILIIELLSQGGPAFSFFSLPSGSYLSSALASVSRNLQVYINTVLATSIENILFVGLSVYLFLFVLPGLGLKSKNTRTITVAVVSGIGFALLHGAATLKFLVTAAAFMGIIIYSIFGEDLQLFDIPLFEATLLLSISLHAAINISSQGGLGVVFNALSTAPFPLSILVNILGVFLGIVVVYAVVGIIQLIFTGRIP